MAHDLREGSRLAPSFEDGVAVHRIIAAMPSRDFSAAVETAGKPVQLIAAPNDHYREMVESLGNPHGLTGRSALALMKLAPT
jgi:hypothetical protein